MDRKDYSRLPAVNGRRIATWLRLSPIGSQIGSVRRRRCQTKTMLLDGAPAEAWSFFAEREIDSISAVFGWSAAIAQHLVNRYGTHARQVAEIVRDRDECKPVVAGELDLLGEWEYQRREEMAVMRADHLLRRSRIGLWHGELFDER